MKQAHRRAHRLLWTALLFVIPGLLTAAFLLRQDFEAVIPAERIGAPSTATDGDAG